MGFNSGFKGLIQLMVQSLCASGRPVYRTATSTEWLHQMSY